jgi:1,4-alpha-glucan branching enzyme
MLDKMPGDVWQKFANLRLLYSYQYAHPGKKLLFMGGEFGQWDEWSESKSLDWVVSGMDKHAGLYNLLSDLNDIYRSTSAMHYYDFNQQGFQWISCDDVDNSVLAFMRRDQHSYIICLFNFTPAMLQEYVIGVPDAGTFKEVFNSDAAWYGGTDVGNGGEISSLPQPDHGFEQSLKLTLPPLAALFLEKKLD